MKRLLLILVSLAALWCPAFFSAEAALANADFTIGSAPLTLHVYFSKTANLFHVVDQISQWSEFSHKQYLPYFKKLKGGLSKEDQELLAQHRAIRRVKGIGGGLEQTFYTPLGLDAALDNGVKESYLSKAEAASERRILLHFRTRVDRLMQEEAGTLARYAQAMRANQADLSKCGKDMARFVGSAGLIVPVYLIANPDRDTCGGGYNGGRLTLEIREKDMSSVQLHELFHAFLWEKIDALNKAARSVPGLNLETLAEGLAYAYSPGLFDPAHQGDTFLATAADFMARRLSIEDSYARFNLYGLALRPLLRDALAKKQPLEAFLPRATDAWLVFAELERARNKRR